MKTLLLLLFFLSSPNFGHKTALILGEFPEKVRLRQNFCAQRPQKLERTLPTTDTISLLKYAKSNKTLNNNNHTLRVIVNK